MNNRIKDKALIRLLQGDIPLLERPFAAVGAAIGLPEDEVLTRVREWMGSGALRRFGAVLSQTRAGKTVNAMVVWNCPAGRLEEVGKLMATFDEVSHCYERETPEGWSRNLFTMVHADDAEHCGDVVNRMAALARLSDYELLFTEREFKKTSWEIDPD